MLVSRLRSRRLSRQGANPQPPTFTRASTANDPYTGAAVASGVPRFPAIAGSVGVLVEEGTTNLFQFSTALDNAYWSKTNTAVTPNAGTAPDGTNTAFKLVDNATSGQHNINKFGPFAAGAATASFFAKAAELSSLRVGDGTGLQADFNLATGVVSGIIGTAASATMTPVAGGWYRCTLSGTAGAGAGINIILVSGGNQSYAGTGQGVLLWLPQAEQKAYATSAIPTLGAATATRAAETLTIPTAGVLRPDQGTIGERVYIDGPIPPAVRFLFEHKDSGTAADRIYLRLQTDGTLLGGTSNGTATGTNVTTPALGLTAGWHTFALRWSAAEVSVWVDGIKKGATATPNLPSVMRSTFKVGSSVAGDFQLNQPIDALRISSLALSDAEMAQATAGALIDVRGQTYAADFNGSLQQYGRGLNISDRLDVGYL